MKTKISARKRRILQGLTHISTVILVATAFLLIYLLVSPFERGFYCTDESIRYPYRVDTIPLWAAGAYAIISAIAMITFTEFYLYPPCCARSGKPDKLRFVLTTARGVFIYALGAISTLLVTEIGKHTIGRLRYTQQFSSILYFCKKNYYISYILKGPTLYRYANQTGAELNALPSRTKVSCQSKRRLFILILIFFQMKLI